MAAPSAPVPRPTSSATKPYKGMAMEGVIAAWYSRIREKDDEVAPLVRQVTERLPAGRHLLEVASGPGYLAIELARTGRYQITGLDISQSFVRIAREKAAAANVTIDFQEGNAAALPFADSTFDFIICRAAFKNFTEPVQAVREMYRVLRPGGTALIIDLRSDAQQTDIDRHVETMHLNAINAWLTRWTFKHFLLKNAYTAHTIRQIVAQTEFTSCTIDVSDIGLAVWLER